MLSWREWGLLNFVPQTFDSLVGYPEDVDTVYKIYCYCVGKNQYAQHVGNLYESQNGDKLWYQYINWVPLFPPFTLFLIMDLTLKVGDTFPDRNWIIDSVYFDINGRKVIRFNQNSFFWNESIKFIEGVGPSISLTLEHHIHLSCFYRQGIREFTTEHPLFEGCWSLITDSPVKKNPNKIVAFCSNEDLQILQDGQPARLQNYSDLIYDLNGSLAARGTLTGKPIPLPYLKKGFYIIQIVKEHINAIFISKFLNQ